ncbi:MAG: preprotein translocase subunit YajC [Prevotella sp.]|jgi:preprotein translocase subunit YajC|nr:preprotein translocase subunit YajC [Prevotella sp.]
MSLLHVFLQGSGDGMQMIVMMVAIIAIFYFFMIRPQQKKQKAIQKARDEMKAGDKVVTAGGVHGKIKEVGDTNFIVEIAENVRIKIEKSSVYAAAEDVAK